MKSLDMFCASQAATAICMSLEQHVVSSSTATIQLGSARHNPTIDDGSRRSVSSLRGAVKRPSESSTSSSASSQHNLKPKRTSTYSKLYSNTREKKSSDEANGRKSSASLVDAVRKSSCIKPSAYFTPPGSKRYLLAENDSFAHSDRVLALVPTETKNVTDPEVSGKSIRASSLKNEAPSFASTSDKYYSLLRSNSDRVVVVRVSLHCKGCAGKVKKHISKLQGVTSFDVDFDAKKVTVVGDVTLLEVLATISKVRTAQLLPPEKPNPTLAPRTNNAKQVLGELIKA
ncbi:hypothetical protein QQ045_022357 [Rhodiola kirilowii]